MYKSQSKAEQFMTRTGSFATHGTRSGADRLGGGAPEVLTPDQQRAVLVAALTASNEELRQFNLIDRTGLTSEKNREMNFHRKRLAMKHQSLVNQIIALKPLCQEHRYFEDLGSFIIEVMKERMTKPEWRAVLLEAERRFKAQGPIPDACANDPAKP